MAVDRGNKIRTLGAASCDGFLVLNSGVSVLCAIPRVGGASVRLHNVEVIDRVPLPNVPRRED